MSVKLILRRYVKLNRHNLDLLNNTVNKYVFQFDNKISQSREQFNSRVILSK
jgi:hypothetical protein